VGCNVKLRLLPSNACRLCGGRAGDTGTGSRHSFGRAGSAGSRYHCRRAGGTCRRQEGFATACGKSEGRGLVLGSWLFILLWQDKDAGCNGVKMLD